MQSGAVENQVFIEWEWIDMFFFLIIPNLYSRLVHHGEPPATESYWIVGFHTELCATSQPSFLGTVGGHHFFEYQPYQPYFLAHLGTWQMVSQSVTEWGLDGNAAAVLVHGASSSREWIGREGHFAKATARCND